MDEDQYSFFEESIPLSSQSCFWKKNSSISSAVKSQNKTEAWMQTVMPSDPQVPGDSPRIHPETKARANIHAFIALPGSVDYSEDIQEHPSCMIKSVMTEDTPEEDADGDSWLHKLGMNINKWSFLNSLTGQNENRALEKVDNMNTSGVGSDVDHKTTELEECTTKEVPYIPYKLATLYIIKIVEDMHQMKNKHMDIIRQLDNIRKENQERTITTLKKHYGEKMRSLKSQIEAYHELMNKSNTHCQNTVKSLRERNRQLIQEKEKLLHQMKQQTEKWEEEKVQILENLCKNLDYVYIQHTLTLQELHNISLYVERVKDLVNFQILQQKSENTEGEKADVPVVLELKTEQVANEEENPQRSVEKGYLWQAHAMLQKIQESLHKREREVTDLLRSERRYNKTMKPQITVLIFLKSLVKKVHTIYCDVPGAQQYISHLIRKNEDERANRRDAFNNAQADILSEVFYEDEPMDDKRTQHSTKLFRNLGKVNSDLEYVETEKIVFDCIQTGEIPHWIIRDCLYVALTEDPEKLSEVTEPPSTGTQAEV